MDNGLACEEVYGDVIIEGLQIQQMLFDHLALVTKGKHELVHALLAVDVPNVPQDRLSTDLHPSVSAVGSSLPPIYFHIRPPDLRLSE
jgi:hypothetical protein